MIRLMAACLLGLLLGFFLPSGLNVNLLFLFILPALLFSVGLSLGNIDMFNLFLKNKKYILLPLFSLVGSCVFSILYAVIRGNGIMETLLAGSAMGFSSLPAVLVTSKISVASGTLVLITNMLRESFTILLAPLILRVFGKNSLVAMGGATTMDVSLAVIKEAGGEEIVPIALLNGLILTLGVPFFISLMLNLHF